MARHLLEAGVVPALAAGIKTVQHFPDLLAMAKATAEKLNERARDVV